MRITLQELARRLSEPVLRVFAPHGDAHRLDGGEPAEPLGVWKPDRLAQLATELDCVLVGGADLVCTDADLSARYGVDSPEPGESGISRFMIEGLGREWEGECAVAWHGGTLPAAIDESMGERLRAALAPHAYVAVGDETSRHRLEGLGLDRDIAVVPDLAFIVPRLFPAAVLEKRVLYLRRMGWYPDQGSVIVVQSHQGLTPWAREVAAAVAEIGGSDAPVVLAQLAPWEGDGAFADAFTAARPDLVYRLPAEASQEDVAAAIWASGGFIGSSRYGLVTAFSYGKPLVALSMAGNCEADSLSELIGGPLPTAHRPFHIAAAFTSVQSPRSTPEHLQARVDTHFDRVAEIAERAAWRRRGADGADPFGALRQEVKWLRMQLAVLRRANQARGERLISERVAWADQLVQLQRELAEAVEQSESAHQQLEQLNLELARWQEGREAAEAELDSLRRTRTFRWTAPARAAYRRLRRAQP